MPNVLVQMIKSDNKVQINQPNKCKCYEYFHKNYKFLEIFYSNFTNSQLFSVGYILLICTLGTMNFEILDNLEYYFNLFLKNASLKKLQTCCFYHLITSMELFLINQKITEKIKNKFSISYYASKKKFSDNYINFLCRTLTFDPQGALFKNTKAILNHAWLSSLTKQNSSVKINLKELVKISRETQKSLIQNFNEKKLQNFLTNFEIILSNNRLNKEEFLKRLNEKKSILKELSRDSGVHISEMLNLLKNKIVSLK